MSATPPRQSGPTLAAMLIEGEQTNGLTVRAGSVAQIVLDDQQQGYVEVAGRRTYSMWVCGTCAIPTGGSDRKCRNHPDAAVFLKSIREEPLGNG